MANFSNAIVIIVNLHFYDYYFLLHRHRFILIYFIPKYFTSYDINSKRLSYFA